MAYSLSLGTGMQGMGVRHLALRWITGLAIFGGLPGVMPAAAQSDPPATVARLARITGTVSIRDAGEESWRVGRVNLPLPPGDAVWVEPGGQAVLDLAASRIGLAGGTELRLDALEDQALEATLAQGEIHLRLLHTPANTVTRIHTPRGIASLAGDGRYAILAGNATRPTVISVFEGSAKLDVPGASTTMAASQAATITGNGPYQVSTGPARLDAFAVAMMAQEPRIVEATPALVRQMTGVGDLAQYGEWRRSSELGMVWVPRVEAGWVPYRDGVWAWVEPWGWTWVDDAPWGFAPFHYGRWARIHQTGIDQDWAWVPAQWHTGVGFRPAYAPALVRFLGMRRPAGQTVAPRRGAFSVLGWVPLGPNEAYRPGFAGSPAFLQRLNMNHVRNASATGADGVAAPALTGDAATLVPAWAMLASRPTQLARTRLPPLPPEGMETIQAADLPGPVPETVGMTPFIAERMGLIGPGAEQAPQRARLHVFPTLRPAGAGGLREPGTAPGPDITPAFPGLRRAPGPPPR